MFKPFTVFLFFLLHCNFFFSQIRINELSSKKGFTDEYNNDVDWIEITNIGSTTENLHNYYLSDDLNSLGKWRFPQTSLLPSEKMVICGSGRVSSLFPDHWEAIVLAENTWKYFLGNSSPGSDWNSSTFNDQSWNSGQGGFGYGDNDDNTQVPVNLISIYLRKVFTINDLSEITHLLFHADYDDGFVAYLNGIEIMRSNNFNTYFPNHNTTTNSDHEAVLYSGGIPESKFFSKEDIGDLLVQGDNLLAIQVHNAGSNSSDMTSNFFLSAGVVSSNFNFQPLPSWITPPLTYAHCNFKLSNNETVIISNNSGNIIDSLTIPNSLTNQISTGRSPDGTGNWCFFDQPSPGLSNGNSWCYDGVAASPVIDALSGWYTNSVSVNLSSNQNIIRYTTNGDLPTTADPIFTNALNFNSSTVFSARAFSSSNELPSAVIDRTYIINEQNHGLPVFSIITDEDNLWDWNTGIYVPGPNATTNYPYFGSNFWEPWSKWSRLEYFDGSRIKQFETEIDLEIHGGWSRAEPQKSFRIDTKSKYSGDINYPLIPQKSFISDFNNFNLRNGGQHTWSDRIQDGVISRLVKGSNTDRMAYQPCILYLNGDYWGLYGLREKIDEHYVESNHGINSNNIDLLNKDGALAGSSDHFNATYQMIQNMSYNDTNFLSLFESRFDIDNYIDYFIIQTYIQNMDWLGIAWGLNNVKLWRPDTNDGKWRYVLYDTDASFGFFGQNIYDNYLSYARNPAVSNDHSQIFNKVLLNPEFKCRFANRYDDLINTTFQPENFTAVTNEIKDEIASAIQDHVNRWASLGGLGSFNQWSNAINTIIQYNASRISTARTHLGQSLALGNEKNVLLHVVPENSGSIKINTISPDNYPWQGKYHGNCPMDIIATADSGYTFSHWDDNAITASNPIESELLNVEINSSLGFVANFITCEESIDVSLIETNNQLIGEITGGDDDVQYSWFANDHLISNDSIIYNPNNGVYQLKIKKGNCEIESDYLIIEDDDYEINIYPNPAQNEFELVFVSTLKQDITITFYNTLGQTVKSETLEQFVGQYKNKYDVSELAKEVYFMKVTLMNKTHTRKIILVK